MPRQGNPEIYFSDLLKRREIFYGWPIVFGTNISPLNKRHGGDIRGEKVASKGQTIAHVVKEDAERGVARYVSNGESEGGKPEPFPSSKIFQTPCSVGRTVRFPVVLSHVFDLWGSLLHIKVNQ